VALVTLFGLSVQAEARPPLSLPDVAERAVKSVVNISSTKRVLAQQGSEREKLFRRYFGQKRPMPQERGGSLGSGVIISKDGLILTNSHVVHESTNIKVTLENGRELGADIVGTDPKSDVAVLRIRGNAEGLIPMAFGDSKGLRLGETVIAIGNPFGLGHTVTMGIVSAKGRAGMGINDYEDFIQTDAAINPGNSGGALVNTRGELVGINTAIYSRTGGYQGIGFAIPTDMAVAIKDSLVETGTVRRGWLGVSIQELNAALAERLGAATGTKGVIVSGVIDGTPADRAGLQSGDIIVSVDDAPTGSPSALRNRIAMKGQGSSAQVAYIRDGKRTQLTVVLGELENETPRRTQRPSVGKSNTLRGMTIGPLDREVKQALDLPRSLRGVVVSRVEPNSPSSRAGLRRGDVIVAANRRTISSVAVFRKLMKKSEGEVLLRLKRGSSSVFVILGQGGKRK
jgi:serine protease Do